MVLLIFRNYGESHMLWSVFFLPTFDILRASQHPFRKPYQQLQGSVYSLWTTGLPRITWPVYVKLIGPGAARLGNSWALMKMHTVGTAVWLYDSGGAGVILGFWLTINLVLSYCPNTHLLRHRPLIPYFASTIEKYPSLRWIWFPGSSTHRKID